MSRLKSPSPETLELHWPNRTEGERSKLFLLALAPGRALNKFQDNLILQNEHAIPDQYFHMEIEFSTQIPLLPEDEGWIGEALHGSVIYFQSPPRHVFKTYLSESEQVELIIN
jgi:hypothetical protein